MGEESALDAARQIAALEVRIIGRRWPFLSQRATFKEAARLEPDVPWEELERRRDALMSLTTPEALARARSERARAHERAARARGEEYVATSEAWVSVASGGLPTLGKRH